MSAGLYEPINIYKPLRANIGTVDGPFEYFTIAGIRMPMPFTTRMTVIRLSGGDLWLHSPIVFEASLAAELQRLGTVRHLISPNQWHYAHIGEWQKAFPEAVAWSSPGVRQRARARHIDVHFNRDLEIAPPPEWRNELDQTVVPGGVFKEFIFFHRASATLILTDTIMNMDLVSSTSRGERPPSSPVYIRHTANSSSGCAFHFCFSGRRRRPRFRKSVHGIRSASSSAMGDASNRTLMKSFDGCSAECQLSTHSCRDSLRPIADIGIPLGRYGTPRIDVRR